MFSSEHCEEHVLMTASDFFKTATEQRWAAVSVLRLYLKIFKAVPKNNPRTQTFLPQQNKKTVENTCLFQILYSRKVAETAISLKQILASFRNFIALSIG